MNNKIVYYVTVLLILPAVLFSQAKVSGRVLDQNGRALPSLEVSASQNESNPIKTVTDNNGAFTLELSHGGHTLAVKQQEIVLYKSTITVTGDINSDIVIKSAAANALSEVIVQSTRKLFETKADRIVYNISNDAFNKGSNLIDALKRVPRLEVENDAVKITGKSGSVKFLIDGRMLNLSEEVMRAKIRGLRAEQIAKVEVIPVPPSRYSAEGNGGMINIILKKDENNGLQGSVNSGLGVQHERPSTDQGANLNLKAKKFDTTLNLSNSDTGGSNVKREFYDFENTSTAMDNLSDFNFRNTSANAVLQYKISSKLNAGTSMDIMKASNKSKADNVSQYYSKTLQMNDSLLYSVNKGRDKNSSYAVSLFADYALDTLGRKISLTYNHSYNKNLSDSDNRAEIVIGQGTVSSIFSTQGDNRYKVNGIIADFELPFTFGRIETGVSYTDVNTDASILYMNAQNIIDPKRSNLFEYQEQTAAGYFSIQKEWNKKWSSKIGLRFESTEITGYSVTLAEKTSNKYAKLFPALFVSYNPGSSHVFTFSYSKRLDRPTFYDLNPFRYYSNAYNYLSGNPNLMPVYTDTAELSYTLKNNLNFTAYGNYITDGISYLTQFGNDNAYAVHPENNFTQRKAGIIGSYTWRGLKWYSITLNANGYYTDLKSEKAVQQIKGLGGRFSLRNSLRLNESRTSLLEASYTNFLPSKALYSDFTSRNQAYFTINFKQLFLDNDMVFNLYVTDIFKQNIGRSEKQYDTFYYSLYNDIRNRGFYFSLNYTFGNKKVGETYRDTKNTERYRAGK